MYIILSATSALSVISHPPQTCACIIRDVLFMKFNGAFLLRYKNLLDFFFFYAHTARWSTIHPQTFYTERIIWLIMKSRKKKKSHKARAVQWGGVLELSGRELRQISASHAQSAAPLLLTPLGRDRNGTAMSRRGNCNVEEKVSYYNII